VLKVQLIEAWDRVLESVLRYVEMDYITEYMMPQVYEMIKINKPQFV